jgi:hypothetical protein
LTFRPGTSCSPPVSLTRISHESIVSGNPYANRREARKLGLLHEQKFRSRTRVSRAAGANDRVWRGYGDVGEILTFIERFTFSRKSFSRVANSSTIGPTRHRVGYHGLWPLIRVCPRPAHLRWTGPRLGQSLLSEAGYPLAGG